MILFCLMFLFVVYSSGARVIGAMLLAMKPAHKMRPAFPAFFAPRGATTFDTDLAELGCHRPTAFALGKDRVGRVCARAVLRHRGGDEERGEES